MMVKIANLKSRADVLATGEWTRELAKFDGLKLRLRPTMNADWQKRLFSEGAVKDETPDAQEERTWGLIRDTCITGWNVTDDDGEPVPYESDNPDFADLFEHPEFRSAVRFELILLDTKTRDSEESAGKN